MLRCLESWFGLLTRSPGLMIAMIARLLVLQCKQYIFDTSIWQFGKCAITFESLVHFPHGVGQIDAL
jgi:hypothetical protein